MPPEKPAPRPRLGVSIELTSDGVAVREVEKGSVAEATGIQGGDVVLEVAGLPARQPGEVVEAIQRQAPGTWLPIKVRRKGETLDLIAKFPPLSK
jgi:S1-C subfamily serine protease